jgi:hypothetical protein
VKKLEPLYTVAETANLGYAATARRSAARASSRVESSVGNGELVHVSGISVQPSTTASQPASFIQA